MKWSREKVSEMKWIKNEMQKSLPIKKYSFSFIFLILLCFVLLLFFFALENSKYPVSLCFLLDNLVSFYFNSLLPWLLSGSSECLFYFWKLSHNYLTAKYLQRIFVECPSFLKSSRYFHQSKVFKCSHNLTKGSMEETKSKEMPNENLYWYPVRSSPGRQYRRIVAASIFKYIVQYRILVNT